MAVSGCATGCGVICVQGWKFRGGFSYVFGKAVQPVSNHGAAGFEVKLGAIGGAANAERLILRSLGASKVDGACG